MSAASRGIRVALAAAAVFGVGLIVWLVAGGTSASNATAERSPAPTEAAASPAVAATPVPTPTPAPTATPLPTPTPVPVPVSFADAVPLADLADVLQTPLPGCNLARDDERVAGTVTLACIGEDPTVPVVAAASGRVVDVVREPAVELAGGGRAGEAPIVDEPGHWSWLTQGMLGPHVVIDHGPLGDTANTQTVYAGLDTIDPAIRVGAEIGVGDPVGSVAGPGASLRFSVWSDGVRQDGARVLADEGPPIEVQQAAAAALNESIVAPTDPRCPLILASGQLPGASRDYRNGTHRGIDFGCGAADRMAHAIAPGTVVYLVDDYVDPSPQERNAVLADAAIAASTPQWTLAMLYGNFVVIDHGEIPGAGRVLTISAHLERVDPRIRLGSTVAQDQVIGEIGNRGTDASARGIRGSADPSLHLHWELFVDDWYLGSGLSPSGIIEVISLALCGAAQTPGCPA